MAVEKELSVFVRNLPVCPLPEMEELLYELFLQSGPLNKVLIPHDKETGAHRGYGLVEYMHVESVAYTCALMSNIQLLGKTLWVHPMKSSNIENDKACDEAIESVEEESIIPEMADNGLDSTDHLGTLDSDQAQLLHMLFTQAAANFLPPPPPPSLPMPPLLHDYPPPPFPPLLPPPLRLPCSSATLPPPLPPPPPHLLTPPPLLPGISIGTSFPLPPPGFPPPEMANFSFSVFPPPLPPVKPSMPGPIMHNAFPITQAECFAKRRRKKGAREESGDKTYPTANWQTIT